ncbi:predicted protein [Phaeodactylum tricornutum CCAP 1055/1]|jgi:hypothetical protein|uniref:Uncharacterized protein n=3 Tax=Phaeodactylum tricornutum TaxID=2850 RepID=B7G689_PHATC|nr:predicted protein [Phaeodactylum tricornutum CCAP 1055/1]EEC45970.1 predicted protein [Phaeodactylum tricornutum CCAP 1055/1]|eukprot:XP_002182683.1 predicted protein [Phaeodactylum tricornutum CCAP 1055/1]
MSANVVEDAEVALPVADLGDEAAFAVDEDGANATPPNKWSKNGFGAEVEKQSGKFSKDESELVRKSVEEFCAAKQISTARLCSECDHKAELKGAWMEIAKQLPHRSVQSVYRHGIRQLHPFKRGAWSDTECTQLVELVQRLGKKWSSIQSKLNRSADSCRDKYREMSDEYVRGRWKESETEILKRLIREHLNVEPTTDMKTLGKMVEDQNIQIPWSTISKRMVKRSRLSCFKKWQKMTGLYSPADDYKRTTPTKADTGDEPVFKRAKVEHLELDDVPKAGIATSAFLQAPTAGAAAALAAGNVVNASGEYDEIYDSAKMADETVQAVDLPDTDVLVPGAVRD